MVNYRVLWHAANLRDGANGFTSPAKEGMLRNFSPEKSDGFGWERTRDLGSIWTYGIPLWGTTSNSNIAILQTY
jgi:hypothetical protein